MEASIISSAEGARKAPTLQRVRADIAKRAMETAQTEITCGGLRRVSARPRPVKTTGKTSQLTAIQRRTAGE